jgi:hypothetical protein
MNSIYQDLPLYPTDVQFPVRFLRLLPATCYAADIEVEVLLGSLDGPVEFEALSYTWGSPEDLVTISVQARPRHVTQNLAAALRRLRLPDAGRLLWVDALCINQADESEKSLQVAQMRQVYTSERNKQVVVWLGDEGTAQTAFDFIKTIRQAEEYNTKSSAKYATFLPELSDVERLRLVQGVMDKLKYAESNGIGVEEFLEKLATPAEKQFITNSKGFTGPRDDSVKGIESLVDGCDAERAACDEFFARPWWSRTWILQEAIHSRGVAVHVGDLEPMPIEHLCQMAARYQRFTNIRLGHFDHRATKEWSNASWFPDSAANLALWLRIRGTARSTADTIITLRKKYIEEGEAAAVKLLKLLLQLRGQQATDPRDKVYGLLGLSANEYAIEPDYSLSKEVLYTKLARRMMKNVMYVLLWVESPQRKIGEGKLPSWVPDHSTVQTYKTITMNQQWLKFAANRGFPLPSPGSAEEPHLSQDENDVTLVLRGIRVGEITEVRDAQISEYSPLEGDNVLRLLGYEASNVRYNIDADDGTPGTLRNASWGPCYAEVGDIIIVVPGSYMPIVVRRTTECENDYLLVGACWLVNAELQDLGHLEKDPGFSPVMFGSACVGVSPEDIDIYNIR